MVFLLGAPFPPFRAHDGGWLGEQTANHFGTPLKVYGRDNNRHREGRRNFVEHVDHEDPIDKSKRTRVRFNVEGPHGHGMAYAEVGGRPVAAAVAVVVVVSIIACAARLPMSYVWSTAGHINAGGGTN